MNVISEEVSATGTANIEAVMPVHVIDHGEGVYEVTCPDTNVLEDQKKVKLIWEMKTTGWEILGIHGLPYPVFTKKSKDGLDYKCKDKNPTLTDYDYTLIVGRTEEKLVLLLDPTIKNGGSS